MTSCKDAMDCYKSAPISSITIGDKTKLQIIGTGNVKMTIMVDGKLVKCTIENALTCHRLDIIEGWLARWRRKE
jgi:hypothetical protein